jgi:hypothetical protein
VLAALLSFLPAALQATPYASGVTNDAGTIRFILNEDAHDVQVTFDGGTGTNELGALTKGSHSFSLGAATNFQIRVSKASANGFVHKGTANSTFNTLVSPRGVLLQISSDADPLLSFSLPRGLTVNRNPRSPYFGRIYVANSSAGTVTSNATARVLGDGIYVLNADQSDALGMGDTPLDGGLAGEFAAGGTASPYRLTIGQDDNLYISDWSDANGTLFVTDPNVGAGSGANVLPGLKGAAVPVGLDRVHGSINQSVVEGSLAEGNLTVYTIDEDLQDDRTTATLTQLNSLWRYDIGSALPPVYSGDPSSITMPTRLFTPGGRAGINFVAQTMDMERGPSGHFYITDNRQNNGSTSGLIVRDPTGGAVWNSSSTTLAMTGLNTSDYCFEAYGVSVSADQKYVVSLRRNSQCFVIPLTNNVPDLYGRLVVLTFPSAATTTGRAVRFDAAGNLYVVSTHLQMLRIFSPGGTTLAVTGDDATGTNGTFRLVTAPVFRVQPNSQYVDVGNSFTLVSYVEGMGEVSYQWQFNGTDIDGETSITYSKSNFQLEDAGNYTLVASNELGVATSSTAVLAVTPAPVILSLDLLTANEVVTTWSSVTGRTYRVEFNLDLDPLGWQTIADVLATNVTTSVTNDPFGADQQFYRVVLLP